ncbi:MAG: CDGSH iron-sulfur domain-containing protein [Candidatus Lambdaproteobacteria bacterium]|nr:CDGSH iron-sulfur domain-containing protein [Candidatus Lambdaproteobacteria bacterium]
MTEPTAKPAPPVSITVRHNGPYLVRGACRLVTAGGAATGDERMALCRCGQSANKPFCDSTHKRIGFDGTEVADRGPIAARRIAYRGQGVTIFDDRSVCAHAGACSDTLAKVFKYGEEPWIDPLGASAQEIARTVALCPSGALTVDLDSAGGSAGEPAAAAGPPCITALKDGPLRVEGAIPLASPDGAAYEARPRYTLCRCGRSKNKPFCDGSHHAAGFKDG